MAMTSEWQELKARKESMSEAHRAHASNSTLSPRVAPLRDHLRKPARDLIKHQVEAERYWFQKIEVFPGYFSPGWSDPRTEKLPYFGLPADLTGKRVLDIGC